MFTIFMMYIAVYPLAYTIRASDRTPRAFQDGSFEFRYKRDREAETVPRTAEGKRLYKPKIKKPTLRSFINLGQWYSRKIALRDATWIFLGIWMIAFAESSSIYADPGITMFKVAFEAFSAYGTVGLSLGYPGLVTSFSAVLSSFSKVVIIFLILIGRCRGLPDSLDYAVIPRSSKALARNLRRRYDLLQEIKQREAIRQSDAATRLQQAGLLPQAVRDMFTQQAEEDYQFRYF